MILFVVHLYSSSGPLILQNSISIHSSLFAILSYHSFMSNHRREQNLSPVFVILQSVAFVSNVGIIIIWLRKVSPWGVCVDMGMAMFQGSTMHSWWQEIRNSVINFISQYGWYHVFHIVNAQQKMSQFVAGVHCTYLELHSVSDWVVP